MTDKMSGVENDRQEFDGPGQENDGQQHRMNVI